MKTTFPIHLFVLFVSILSSFVYAEEKIVRTWTDKTGNFQVKAELIKLEQEKVQLLKEDNRLITIPLTVLSEEDQAFLKEYSNQVKDPFAGGTPLMKSPATAPSQPADNPAEVAQGLFVSDQGVKELPVDGKQIFIKSDEPISAIEADPFPAAPKFSPYIRGLGPHDAYVRVSMPVLIDAQQGIFAVSAHRLSNAVADHQFGKIYLVSSKSKTTEVVLDIKPTIKIVDHHAGSGRTLAIVDVGDGTERGGDLLVIEQLQSGKPKALFRWHLPEYQKPGFKPKVEFAKLLSAETALVQVNDTVYYWNLATGYCIFRIDDVRSGSKIQTSGTAKYLGIPTGGGCLVVDVEAEELIGKVSLPSLLTPEIHFSPSGSRLAMTAGNMYLIWNLTKAEPFTNATMGSQCGDFFGWIGEEYLLTSLAGLIDPEIGRGIWSYALPSGRKVFTIPGGAVALDQDHKMSTLISLPIPHPAALQAKEQLAKVDDSQLAVKPGSEVSLQIETIEGVDEKQIYDGLKTAVENAGWKVVDQAPVTVTAEIARGKTRELRFRWIGSSLFGRTETASLTPYTARLIVAQGEKLLWSRYSENMVPFILRLKEGEDLQEAVKNLERADPLYFSRLDFPPKIFDPEISNKIGRSTIKNGVWNDYFPSNFRR